MNAAYLPQIGFGIKSLDENGVLTSTAVLQQVKDVNKDLDLQERSRMLYVAMTRAEEHLILSGVLPSSSKEEEKPYGNELVCGVKVHI